MSRTRLERNNQLSVLSLSKADIHIYESFGERTLVGRSKIVNVIQIIGFTFAAALD